MLKNLITIFFLIVFYNPAIADEVRQDTNCDLIGLVISVTDGDTLKILNLKNEYIIRLAGIDAPEKGQPYGKAAKNKLSELIANKSVCVIGNKIDKYHRLIGKITYEGLDINLEMIKFGYAWHYKKYMNEQNEQDRLSYAHAQEIAKSSTIGLWQEPYPINPSDWRSGQRTPMPEIKFNANIVSPTDLNSCGMKRFCKQMNNCEEACHYFQDCGISRLDGNKDGIPCESLCSSNCIKN